jgi:hypothetical protein
MDELLNEEHHNLYSSTNNIRVINSMKRFVVNVADGGMEGGR